MSEQTAQAADVGRWFSTAARTPRPPAWGPVPGGAYGTVSPPEEVRAALALLRGRPTAVLTGAGMSTGSGLPDYRGPDAVPRSPMTFQEFVGSDLSRRRYWARSTVGWTPFRRAAPNASHRRLAELARPGHPGHPGRPGHAAPAILPTTAVITQNVDGLHQEAGSDPVIDLHGRLDRVRCLGCDRLWSRARLHERMLAMNPELARRLPALAADAAQAPDGDAEVDRTSAFRYPDCSLCGGILKPDVVFFGESTRPEVVGAAVDAASRAEALLVLGSSLSVQSGLRFVRAAVRDGRRVVIVNDGPTRGDDLADLRLHGRLEDVLGAWLALGADG
ncbi:Sir2 family NAD-dependent protein deacetylase [Brachybacterium sp. DNPG3]